MCLLAFHAREGLFVITGYELRLDGQVLYFQTKTKIRIDMQDR